MATNLTDQTMNPILSSTALVAGRWPTFDPFLFCVYHVDHYPHANDQFGPQASLAGRDIGQDFSGKDGWRMYHGTTVPGFPQHPHRGFETVTIARRGYIDHADSLGAAARFGEGDVQWLTAGAGVVHSEMFPLFDRGRPNTVELFQIWVNLPAASKFAPAYFTMFWADRIPRLVFDSAGATTEVMVIAGALGDATPLAPPPDSYASNPASDIAIWTLRMQAGARYTLARAADANTIRALYFYAGSGVSIGGQRFEQAAQVRVRADAEIEIAAIDGACEVLVLQGRPIGEPVAQYGPFVMNTRAELEQTFRDYQQTQFGGWPWPADDPVHPRDAGRFARYPDGRTENPT